MGTVVRVSNHYMVGIVLGILAALVAGAALAFAVMKHLRKKKKGQCDDDESLEALSKCAP